jgi:ATP-binding cassette, subfamily B, bacterial PglK
MAKTNVGSIIKLISELRWMSGRYRNYFLPMIGLFLFSAVTEVVGLGLVAAYAGLLVSPDSNDIANILPFRLEEFFQSKSRFNMLSDIGYMLVVIFFFKGILLIVVNVLIVLITGKIGIELKANAVEAYIHQPYLKYTKKTGGHYIVSTETFTQQSLNSIKTILRLISDGFLAIGVLTLLFLLNPTALVTLSAIIIFAIYSYDRIFRKKLFEYGKELNKNKVIATQALQEGLLGLKEIRVLGQEKYFLKLVRSSMARILRVQVRARVIGLLPEGVLQFALILFVVVSVVLSFEFGKNLAEILPITGLFALAGIRLIPIGINVATSISQLRTIRPGVSELYKDLTDHQRHLEIESDMQKERPPKEILEERMSVFESLDAREVSFSYPGSKKLILDGLDLHIKRGQSIGIMGASGAGKTTLIDILLGLIFPRTGSVFLNGVDIKAVPEEWRAKVAYIPQEIFLLNGTIKSNIAVGESPQDIDNARIIAALTQARLTSLLESPKGLNTLVGERGLRISGGQRQRIAIARAIYFRREVIIMDEATSALDSNTEREISNALSEVQKEHTFVIVAHRESTLKRCDVVYELCEGKLSLMKRQPEN